MDTAGRLHIDQELMDEVSELRTRLRPSEVLLTRYQNAASSTAVIDQMMICR